MVTQSTRNKTEIYKTKSILDGIRTRNPQIRSLVRYPLRHENLKPLAGDVLLFFDGDDSSNKKKSTSERFELPRESSQLISNQSP